MIKNFIWGIFIMLTICMTSAASAEVMHYMPVLDSGDGVEKFREFVGKSRLRKT